MKQALEDAIYYLHGNDNTYLKYHIIAEYIYSNQEDFDSVISNFHSDIQIKNIFGNHNNVCYDICTNISRCYNTLLIDNLDVILIITRKDNAIKISKSPKDDTKYDINIGVIKIDSVVAELNLTKYNSTNWYKYPLYFISAIGVGLLGTAFYNYGGGFEEFLKSD